MREMGWIGGRAGKRREERTGQQEGEAGDGEVARHWRERLRLRSVLSTEEANEKNKREMSMWLDREEKEIQGQFRQ